MEVVTQWLGRIGIAVRSKIQQIVGRASLRQSRALLTHKLASDDAQPNVFEPLTPVVMTDEQSARYLSELRHALLNDQVRNIAITGDYGAGKSSLIRTFVEKHRELNYAWVSLATFGKDGVVDSPSPTTASVSIPVAVPPSKAMKVRRRTFPPARQRQPAI
ncbi:YobI family P-loop NTPase [Pseudomonas sp. S1_F08]